jgi:hypothetical protein
MAEIEGAEGTQKKKRKGGPKKQSASLTAASQATPGAGTHGMDADGTLGLLRYIRGRFGAGYNAASMIKEFTTTVQGWNG